MVKKNQIERILKLKNLPETTRANLEKLVKNKEGVQEILEARVNILDFIKVHQIKMEFIDFIQVCEVVKPRIFTICKSSNFSPRKAEIVISTVHDKLSEKSKQANAEIKENTWTGLTSGYFIDLFEKCQKNKDLSQEKMRYILQDSSFKVHLVLSNC